MDHMTPAQGDLRLLETELAKQLLDSRIPARYAFTGADGKPRVVASWFTWTGTELVMPTFISAPHIRHQAYRVRALRANPDVAVSIDTESFPPAGPHAPRPGRRAGGRRGRPRLRRGGPPLPGRRSGRRLPAADR